MLDPFMGSASPGIDSYHLQRPNRCDGSFFGLSGMPFSGYSLAAKGYRALRSAVDTDSGGF